MSEHIGQLLSKRERGSYNEDVTEKSAVMRGTDNMVVKEIPVPQIKDKEVLVFIRQMLEFVDQMYTIIIMDAVVHTKWIFQRISC